MSSSIILRAGAGAGKTTTLTATFLEFASEFSKKEGRWPRIVVTTFTRKATQELKERLLGKALQDGRQDLFQYVSSKSLVQISTIHGVLSVFLARYGSVIGLTPDYKIMGAAEIKKVARKIIRKYVLADPELQELLDEYDFSSLESMLLIYFESKAEHPNLRFIDRAEMANLCQKVIDQIAQRILRVALEIEKTADDDKWIEYAQALRGFAWTPQGQDWKDYFDHLKSFWEGLKKPQFRKAKPPFDFSLNDELEDLRDNLGKVLKTTRFQEDFWNKHFRNCELFERLAQSFYTDFLQSKLENGILAMSDLETLSLKIITEHPKAAESFANDWDFWMVDEYQDTSPIQVRILDQLIGEKPVFIVGDPQQSIYLFRGARSEVFQEKVDLFQSQGKRTEVKLINYRSNPEVLAFFNHYFTRASNQFSEMEPAPEKQLDLSRPTVQVLIGKENEGNGHSSEALVTVARIQELLAEGVSPEEICVLGRTHRVLEDIALIAQAHGVPVLVHSGANFYDRREVLDALALLKFLLNPHDNLNLVALLRSPWANLSDTLISSFCRGEKSYWREILKHHEQHSLDVIENLLKFHRQAEEFGLSHALRNAMIEFGLFDYSATIDSTGRREANLWKIISLLFQEERRPGFNYLDFLDKNLEALSVDEGGEEADATPVIEPKRVNFMTVHASKGLQFSHVLLPGMGKDPRMSNAPSFSVREDDGLWTLKVRDAETQAMVSSILAEEINSEMREREAQEFYRVLYVALTRAKHGVTLIWDENIDKKSWAASCPLNLEEGLHEEEQFSYLVRKDNALPEVLDAPALEIKKVRKKYQAKDSGMRLKNLSVTEILSQEILGVGKNHATKDLLSGLARAQQGTEAHRVFESLRYSDVDTVKEGLDIEHKKAIDFLYSSLEIPFADLMSSGNAEWGFALKFKEAVLQGQIDLWGRVDGKAWVLDYKTGSQRYYEAALDQLKIYAWALYQMKLIEENDEISLAVVYPFDEVVKVYNFEGFKEYAQELEAKI